VTRTLLTLGLLAAWALAPLAARAQSVPDLLQDLGATGRPGKTCVYTSDESGSEDWVRTPPRVTQTGACGDTPMCLATVHCPGLGHGAAACLAVKNPQGEWACPDAQTCANDPAVTATNAMPVENPTFDSTPTPDEAGPNRPHTLPSVSPLGGGSGGGR
jgi:hypothetical protein